MKSLTPLLASDTTLASLVSGISLDDPVALIPLVGLFLLGLAVGGLLFRRAVVQVDPAVAEKDADSARPAESTPVPASASPALSQEAPAPESVRIQAALEGELSAALLHAEHQDEEIQALGERFAQLREDLGEKQRRIEELSQPIGLAAGWPRHRAVLAHAHLPVWHLGETLAAERQRIGGGRARLERLETRLREEDRRFRDAGESLARARDEVGARLSDTAGTGPAMFALADRLSQTDDQLRVLGQNISGCVTRVGSAREHLQRELTKIEAVARPIQETEERLKDETLGVDETAPALADARTRLAEALEHIASLENGVDQDISEMIGRVDWAVRDSPSGFLKALDRLNDGDSAADLGVSLIESRIWRELNELRGSLSGILVTLQTGAIAAPLEGCGKRRLIEAADRAIAAVEAAQSLPVLGEETAEAVATPPAAEAEMAGLRETIRSREAEIDTLRETIARLEKAAPQPAFDTPAAIATEPESPRPTTGGSRQFIRRLLGLGPGRWESDLDASGQLAAMPAPSAVATLAEARAMVTELRHVPVSQPDLASPQSNGGHHGLPAALSAPAKEADDPAAEILRLKAELAERDTRLARLEADLDARRQPPTESFGLFGKARPRDGGGQAKAGGWGVGGPESLGAGQAFALARESAAPPAVSETPVADAPERVAFSPVPPAGQVSVDLEALGAQSDNRITGLVLFRANDPTLWRHEVYTGANRRARSLDHLPSGLAYLRLRRIDTGEGIVARVTNAQLLDDGDGLSRGFNGANEFFYGAYHLGVFDESLPQEFETRFTFGGWGFGHTVAGSERQASGWEGLPISPMTVFEIAVFRRMPVLGERDRLLDP
jgi:predicted  nucleic acid-binding Zn-ribbon protein